MIQKMECPICLQQIEETEPVQKCTQCVAIYHTQCFDKAQCGVCRKVFDQDLLDQKKRDLLNHVSELEPQNFYDDMDGYPDSDDDDYDAEVQHSSDSDYQQPQVLSARDAVMLFTGTMLTRSMRMTMLDRMGQVSRELSQMHEGILYQTNISNLFHIPDN